MPRILTRVILILFFLAVPLAAGAETPQSAVNYRPNAAAETTIIPDRFLRRWDPVTIFFSRNAGPVAPGSEDHPDKFVSVDTEQPGAYRWLDSRTLQFQPSAPWPSLSRFTWTVDGKSKTLVTLMEPPVSTIPAGESEGLEPVDEITLTFAEPLNPAALAAMVSIELRPLPGVGADKSYWLTKNDFTIKVKERLSLSDEASYVLVLKEPIPSGKKIIVRMRLTLDDNETQSFKEFSFSTAEPFRVTAVGTRGKRYPITPKGSHYTQEQAINGESAERSIVIDFSSTPKLEADGLILAGKNLVGFIPSVGRLAYRLEGSQLVISGDFAMDTLYQVSLSPVPFKDVRGKDLEMKGKSDLFVYFPPKNSYFRLNAGQGIAERFGIQTIPVEGRGEERVDMRIYPISPLDRSYWPFVNQPLETDDSHRPPGPGEEPGPFIAPDGSPSASDLLSHITMLGSPPVSVLVTLPLRRDGGSAAFGLDLTQYLAKIKGKGQPGTYMIGLRDVGAGSKRSWMRLQVTDLSLTTMEEPDEVKFIVTSLSTAMPVAKAVVRLEGALYEHDKRTWVTLAEGKTDASGIFRWSAPGRDNSNAGSYVHRSVRRIVVEKDNDMLVLDPTSPPEEYYDNQWSVNRMQWLQWPFESLSGRGPQPEFLAHIFTERPVYRPEEEVHIKGYLRRVEKGQLYQVKTDGWVIIQGPGDLSWKYPVKLTEMGSFYHKFSEKDLPTGVYTAHLENNERTESYGTVSFQMEAYRIPLFEVNIHAPDKVSLDKEFEVKLDASYYAGGKAGDRPLEWRVTQYPYSWSPKKREGFIYSSDGRFSRTERFQASPRLEKQEKTGDDGSASIILNPAIELTAQPRTYVVEATVTGADDQTVTASKSIVALPAFVLGLKVPRYVEHAKEIAPEIIVVGHDDALVADKDVTVRLFRREWHSTLRASDFSDGIARYLTDVVDEKITEMKIKSRNEPVKIKLPVSRSGVYIVELEAHDRLDRAQTVRVDLYAGGDQPVAWTKPTSKVFSVIADKAKYDPGMTASVVLQSPYQNARALAVIEAPDGNQYQWLDVEGGSATFKVLIDGYFTPRLPVHFILMRGRLAGTAFSSGSNMDVGKPETMAATAWLEVNPVANQMTVDLDYPPVARPGEKIKVGITLKDPYGKPLSGEVTLWLVDQAVLSLGKEQRLDPVPDFVRKVTSFLRAHDTRNMAFGVRPFAENPGGDEGGQTGALDKVTVRKNFKTVPYYNHLITVGPDGKAVVEIQLSDDITNFKVRAKAASGQRRFGFAVGHLSVRLPLIVQPALPRFVRPGDKFTAVAIGRVVEGNGGPGAAEFKVQGAIQTGAVRQELNWPKSSPLRIEFPVEVEQPVYTADGKPQTQEVTFKVGVLRSSDGARDAFEVKLPLREDRARVSKKSLYELKPDVPLIVAPVTEKVRPGTLKRSVLFSDQPGLINMAAGLDFLTRYPYGCTEQQISRARAYLGLRKFMTLLRQDGSDKDTSRAVNEALSQIYTTIDRNGLVAFWPGSQGYVSLTAWAVQFMTEAKEAGFTVDEKVRNELMNSLERSLRSDYGNFIDGESYAERVWALLALAQAGRYNSAYAAELARKAQFLNLDGVASVLYTFAMASQKSSTTEQLEKALWDGIIIRLYQGSEIYGGLQDKQSSRNGLILPSETRTLAQITRSVARYKPNNKRLSLLVDSLVTLGKGDGWGSTNANAEALLALSEILQPPFSGVKPASVKVRFDDKEQVVKLGPANPLGFVRTTSPAAGEIVLKDRASGQPVVARIDTSYMPAADGSQTAAQSNGFVVSRELLLVKKDAPSVKIPLTEAGSIQNFSVGDIIEEHVQVVNPKERNHLAVTVPLVGGMEPLNPRLATSPPEAAPEGKLTLEPTYQAYQDDQAAFYFNVLPAGTYDFYFRTRATVVGTFIQPPAKAEMMYDATVFGNSNGARIVISEKPGK